MELLLQRHTYNEKATLGDLFRDGAYQCHTLEDKVRELGPHGEGKVFGATAIPAGRYRIILGWSQRFGRIMPRLQDVPFFDGILMHKGNTDLNTHGCLLVGTTIAGDDLLTGSTLAWDALWPEMLAADKRGEQMWIEVKDKAA
jgi:hypothetical protein